VRVRGRVSPAKAARILGVHVSTVRRWCRASEAGISDKLPNTMRHDNGYFFIDFKDLRNLSDKP
jgi:transposase